MRNDQVAIAIPTRPTTAAGSSSTSEEQNKALVLRLYSEAAFNQDKTDLVRELVGADFVQHDKSVPGGADGQVKLFQDLKASWDPRYYQHNPAIANGTGPLKQLMQQVNTSPSASTGSGGTQFGHTLSDGDLVWVFSSDYVVADIFRVVDGKIIEHWDVVADGQQ